MPAIWITVKSTQKGQVFTCVCPSNFSHYFYVTAEKYNVSIQQQSHNFIFNWLDF